MRRSLLTYIILVFVLTYSIEGLVYLIGGLQAFSIIASLTMLFPAITAIIVWAIYYRDKKFWKFFGLRLGKIKNWFIHPLMMLLALIIIYLVSYMLNPNQFLNSTEQQDRMKDIFIFLPDVPLFINLLIPIILNLSIGILFSMIAYLGEELGWRAFMYPKLTNIGVTKGLILGGFIWGLWHLPLILMGHNYPNHPNSRKYNDDISVYSVWHYSILFIYQIWKYLCPSDNARNFKSIFKYCNYFLYKRITIQSITLWFNWTCWNSDF